MTISVALCTYNGAQYLPEQLDSLIAQDRPPDEVIACDDRSDDDSSSILDRFAAIAPFPVQVVRNPENLGSTRNFEQAIRLCRGDLIATADQDDRWNPAKLSAIESVFRRDPGVGLAFSNADLIDSEGKRSGGSLWKSVKFSGSKRRQIDRGEGFEALIRRPAVTGAAMTFRATHRTQILPIPPSWIHDEWISLIVAASARIAAIRAPLMEYRVHAGNQVGVSGDTAWSRTRRSLTIPSLEFASRAAQFQELREHLRTVLPDRADRIAAIDGKIRHLKARAAIPEGRIRRLPILVNELVSLRYTRYSGSTLGFVRDLAARAS